ncbi:MAG: DegT/DnrJ/EryC1/StrS family aminotransferase [bacterium]|nr:DegT/DnrJ/EryC1/StrS family aminotransferase [bacterium]
MQRMVLAVDGGTPVRAAALPAWPHFEEADIEAVGRVLRSGRINYWTGDLCRAFEAAYAEHCGTRHAVALANGTVALELALQALGVGIGDEVIVTSRSFMASASAPVLRGATAVFADVDPESQNLTVDTIAPHIGPRTKAIIVVHLAGWPCEMDGIMRLADAHGLRVIEDCAQAHGARYRGRPVGGIGHLGIFSFCQDKIITTGGEGGMLVTDDDGLFDRVWSLKEHGKSRRAIAETEKQPGFKWVHEGFGTNGRLTEMQAALGLNQLGRLDLWHGRRTENATALLLGLSGTPGLSLPVPPAHVEHAWYKFYGFVRPGQLRDGWDRDRVKHAINCEGIPCWMGSCPEIYREQAFVGSGMEPAARFPVAAELGVTSLMFMVHPTLGEQEMADTVAAVKKVLAVAAR